MKNQYSAPVYSTDKGRFCPACAKPTAKCSCTNQLSATPYKDGIVRIQRETKGRKGKGVSLVCGLDLPPDDLQVLAKKLKAKCGSGGTVKAGIIEIQGDHRETIRIFLEKEGIKSKLAGG